MGSSRQASHGYSSLSQEALASTAEKGTLTNVITGSSQQTLHGYRKLISEPNPFPDRFVRVLGSGPVPANLRPSHSLLAFGHMSDTQICDDQSPARVPFMDHRADFDAEWDTASAYRPQERLLPHMAAAMVSSLRNLGAGPETDLPLAFTLITGDMVDNSQFNETRTYIDLMDGGLIRPHNWLYPNAPDEGPGYKGNHTNHVKNLDGLPGWPPAAYYRPDDSGTTLPDWYRQHDFPTIPNLVSHSRLDFMSPGLGMPWYAAFGNHDMSIQGNIPPGASNPGPISLGLRERATGAERIRELTTTVDYPDGATDWASVIADAILSGGDLTDEEAATPDPNRLVLDKRQFMEEHFATTGLPLGHGFNATGKPYYVMPSSGPDDRFKFIALDTTNSNGFGADGWIDNEQWNWLINELKSASSRYWSDGQGWKTNPSAKDKLIVLYGHHTLTSMTKVTYARADDFPYEETYPLGHSGAELEQLLLRFPNVVMLVNGHTHRNQIEEHSVTRAGPAIWRTNGFWEVTSPAAADFPVQSRVIEIGLDTTGDVNGSQNNNYLSIYTTMLDIDAPVTFDPNGPLSDYHQLASVGRELAYNDPGDLVPSSPTGKPKGWRSGEAWDRNTRLILPAPFPMNDFPGLGTNGTHIVTQKADTKDAKILRMRSDGIYSGTIVDFSSSSLFGSDIIGTGQFTNGLKFGNDLVLRDPAGNIRIKLLDKALAEVAYAGYGAHIRGSVEPGTELVGIGDLDGDARSDLIWRHSNGANEAWFGGSIAGSKYLNLAKEYTRPTPDPGADLWKVVRVGDFNADGKADLLWENMSSHSRRVRYMNGADWTSEVDAVNPWMYGAGWDLQPGIGYSAVNTAGDHLLLRKMRDLGSPATDYEVGIFDPDGVGPMGFNPFQYVFYHNVFGWNAADPAWKTVGLGDFNLDSVHDILWRHDGGGFYLWYLKRLDQNSFLGEHGINAVGPEWVFKGLLKNKDDVIY